MDVRSAETVVIPGNTEKIVFGKVEKIAGCCVGLVQSGDKKQERYF